MYGGFYYLVHSKHRLVGCVLQSQKWSNSIDELTSNVRQIESWWACQREVQAVWIHAETTCGCLFFVGFRFTASLIFIAISARVYCRGEGCDINAVMVVHCILFRENLATPHRLAECVDNVDSIYDQFILCCTGSHLGPCLSSWRSSKVVDNESRTPWEAMIAQ